MGLCRKKGEIGNMSNEAPKTKILNDQNLGEVWERVAEFTKMITGDVNVKKDGTLQSQINGVSDDVQELLEKISGLPQDMIAKDTVFNADGSITETTADYVKTTVFNSDGSILETYKYSDGSVKKKKTIFNADGSITERLVS